jgi:hypothetical protein
MYTRKGSSEFQPGPVVLFDEINVEVPELIVEPFVEILDGGASLTTSAIEFIERSPVNLA